MITHTEKTLEETTTAIHQFRFRRFALNNSRAGMRNRGLGARQTIAAPLMVPLDNNKHEPGEGKKKKGWGGGDGFRYPAGTKQSPSTNASDQLELYI